MSTTSIRLQDDLDQPLEALAQKKQRSRNWLINQAVREYVQNQALAEQRWQETIPALLSLKEGRQIPAADVEDWLRSWGSKDEKAPPTS